MFASQQRTTKLFVVKLRIDGKVVFEYQAFGISRLRESRVADVDGGRVRLSSRLDECV